MKYLILLLFLPLSLIISAQDTLSVELVDTPPLLKPQDLPRANAGADQNERFLHGLYSSLRYPAYARQYGEPSVVSVNYLIGIDGKTSIEQTSVFTPEEAAKLQIPEEELVIITAFTTIICYQGGSPPSTPSPEPTITEEQSAKANKQLEDMASASILKLPAFIPGRHEGKPIAVRFTRFFSFRKEDAR